MSLLRLMNEAPLPLVIFGVIFVLEVYSVGLIILCRRIWGPLRLKQNNEVGGFKFATIGVLYAVLLGFVVIAVWEDYQDTATAVRTEAKAVRDLVQLSYALPGGAQLREPLLDYAHHVRHDEWPAMADGSLKHKPAVHLAHVEAALLTLKVESFRDLALYQEALRLLALVQDNRSERIERANGSIPNVLWFALLGGALILLGYPAFFGTPNLLAQISMAAAMAAVVAIVLLPALLLDYPFTGPVHISSEPFEAAVNQRAPHLPQIPADEARP